MVEFKQTPERMEIVRGLQQLTKDATAVGKLIETAGYRVRAHRLLNMAQDATNQLELLALDWRDEDIQSRNAA